MPSSHALALGFLYTGTTILYLPSFLSPISIGLLIYSLIGLYYRILRNLHSLDQVIVGFILGCLDSYLIWGTGFGTKGVYFFESSFGNELSIGALVGLAVFGAITVTWREIAQASRFIKKKT